MDMMVPIENYRHWVPFGVNWRTGVPVVAWCYMGNERFSRSFFDDSIQFVLNDPFNLLLVHQTPFERLGELYERVRGPQPTGFIFHMSRCGSTLVSQMLASVEKNIVISEALPIDAVIRANVFDPRISADQRVTWFRWIVNALGQQRNEAERHYFIKFDSWSTLDMAFIQRAYPDVPWIFLYRDPIEVIVSQMRQRGSQMVPGAIGKTLPDLELADAFKMPPEEYCARVLARFCQIALDHAGSNKAMLVNYTQLPEAALTDILRHFNVEYTADELETMRKASGFDAKSPSMPFAPDSEQKRNESTGAARQAAIDLVDELYQKLEAERLRCSPGTARL